jgi:hypothetical protein
MAEGRGNGEGVVEFDRHLAHALVARAIHQLKTSGMIFTYKQSDWLYRMGMVGIMASYTARGEAVPRAVRNSIVKGTPLSPRRWQDTIGE